MKKIALKVTVEVPNDYVLDEPSWLLENINIGYDYDVEVIENKHNKADDYKLGDCFFGDF